MNIYTCSTLIEVDMRIIYTLVTKIIARHTRQTQLYGKGFLKQCTQIHSYLRISKNMPEISNHVAVGARSLAFDFRVMGSLTPTRTPRDLRVLKATRQIMRRKKARVTRRPGGSSTNLKKYNGDDRTLKKQKGCGKSTNSRMPQNNPIKSADTAVALAELFSRGISIKLAMTIDHQRYLEGIQEQNRKLKRAQGDLKAAREGSRRLGNPYQ